jgi:hypothetical protein
VPIRTPSEKHQVKTSPMLLAPSNRRYNRLPSSNRTAIVASSEIRYAGNAAIAFAKYFAQQSHDPVPLDVRCMSHLPGSHHLHVTKSEGHKFSEAACLQMPSPSLLRPYGLILARLLRCAEPRSKSRFRHSALFIQECNTYWRLAAVHTKLVKTKTCRQY